MPVACVPQDDPADFSYFFNSSSRRSCYLAPERFVEPTPLSAPTLPTSHGVMANTAGRCLTPAMDIFSVGCVLIELMREGEPCFDLPQLLRYRITLRLRRLLSGDVHGVSGRVSAILRRGGCRWYRAAVAAKAGPRLGACTLRLFGKGGDPLVCCRLNAERIREPLVFICRLLARYDALDIAAHVAGLLSRIAA